MNKARPIWVAFEGCDGSGKSTIANAMRDLIGPESVLIPTPSDSQLGRLARQSLALSIQEMPLEARQLVFLSDIIATFFREVMPALMNGKTVISDRWVLSTLVYHISLMRIAGAQDEGVDTATHMLDYYRTMTAGFGPDITFVVNAPEPVRWDRLKSRPDSGDLNEASREFQKIVASTYEKIGTALADDDGGPVEFYENGADLKLSVSGTVNPVEEARMCIKDMNRLEPDPIPAYPGLWERLVEGGEPDVV